jgi:hypothetical protein
VKTAVRVAAIVLLVAVLVPAVAAACPLCKEASSEGDKPGTTSVWRGLYWSILFMVSAPFAMVATMIVMIRRSKRRFAQRSQVAGLQSQVRKPGTAAQPET